MTKDELLKAAASALRSYQCGNESPVLAETIADRIDAELLKVPLLRGIEGARMSYTPRTDAFLEQQARKDADLGLDWKRDWYDLRDFVLQLESDLSQPEAASPWDQCQFEIVAWEIAQGQIGISVRHAKGGSAWLVKPHEHVDKLLRDGLRYRWLRENGEQGIYVLRNWKQGDPTPPVELAQGTELDTVIDEYLSGKRIPQIQPEGKANG